MEDEGAALVGASENQPRDPEQEPEAHQTDQGSGSSRHVTFLPRPKLRLEQGASVREIAGRLGT
jgi:hypothetical protein